MHKTRTSRVTNATRPWDVVAVGAVIAVLTVLVIFNFSTAVVYASGGLERPAATLPPAPDPAGYLRPVRNRNLRSFSGVASWYGMGFDGHETANGEDYDVEAMTAAHRSLPFGSILRVTELGSGSSVIVRVNDRGPLSDSLTLDLSRKAAARLGIKERGIAKVVIEVLQLGNGRQNG